MSMKKKILSVGGVFIAGVLVGSAIMYNDSFYHTVNDALGRGATQNSLASAGNVGGVEAINVSSMDLETALKAVQEQRSQLLEQQLQDQIKGVQDRNNQIAQLNTVLSKAGEIGIPAGSSPDNAINDDQTEALRKAMEEAGISTAPPTNVGQLGTIEQQVKSQIDALSNSQQMDMLRLQSLTNKRNEAFDVMTNFIKKMQESRSSIIGNMR
ncbi:hypothetical protein [Paenibacillus mendelii]|uniref:Secreted protein n=1 Tax=Paenibacillus mendelii TaxID=206163 RepID=A0ABV6JDS6_9BACL|nr:hypothetical protein [Paenibacillus mendelii]MCQ6561609.1 hypothetical protein [Paenibacillus mendelii]